MSTYRLKGTSGTVINQSFTLGERTVIGRADDCDLRLDTEGVASRHAAIELAGAVLRLESLDPENQVLVNGEPVLRAVLSSGDEIRIAGCRFLVQAPGRRPEKVLTEAAVKPRRDYIPWLIVVGLLAAAAGAWYLGLLPF